MLQLRDGLRLHLPRVGGSIDVHSNSIRNHDFQIKFELFGRVIRGLFPSRSTSGKALEWLGQAGANTTLTWINLATEQVHLKKLHTHEREIFMVQRCMDRTFVKLAPFSIFTSGKKRSENVLVTRMKENRNRRAKNAFSNCRSFDLWFSDGQKAIMPTFRVTKALFYSPFPWMKRFPPSDFSVVYFIFCPTYSRSSISSSFHPHDDK